MLQDPRKATAMRGSPSCRFLTDPSEGVSNQGWDNKNCDLIIAVNDIFQSSNGHRFDPFERFLILKCGDLKCSFTDS